MRLPPDLEAKCLALSNAGPMAKAPRIRKKDLLLEFFAPPATWGFGVLTVSEQNSRNRRESIGRKASQRKVVCENLGRNLRYLVPFSEAYHRMESVMIEIVRIAPRPLDRHENLPISLKYIIDGIADMMGANDNSPLFHVIYGQEKHDRYGVRITLRLGK